VSVKIRGHIELLDLVWVWENGSLSIAEKLVSGGLNIGTIMMEFKKKTQGKSLDNSA
jgi:hypothetical protein